MGWGSSNPPTNSVRDPVVVRHVETAGTNGGTATTGSWETRTLNTLASDPSGIASLGSNQITLPAGTYEVWGWATGFRCDWFNVRLYDTTGTAVLVDGGTAYSSAGAAYAHDQSRLMGRFTISASSAIELQQYVYSTRANDGWGANGNLGPEVYAELLFYRVA